MLNYVFKRESDDNVMYVMPLDNGDFVLDKMSHATAIKIATSGTVAVGTVPGFPISVDGKYNFAGSIADMPILGEDGSPLPAHVDEPPKSRRSPKTKEED